MFNKNRITIKQKGQGIIEYAVLLAFIVGLAVMLNGANLSGAVKDTFDSVASLLHGEKVYADYFNDWHKFSSQQLIDLNNKEERLEADRKALALIAGAFLSRDADGVLELMKSFSNTYADNYDGTPQWLKDNLEGNHLAGVNSDGWSDVLVPLSYKTKNLDDNGFIWLEAGNNVNTVNTMTGNKAEVYEKNTQGNITTNSGTVLADSKSKTVSTDRFFYSDDMINQGNKKANDRTIALKVHYDSTGHVDKVQIKAQKGQGSAAKSNWGKQNNTAADLNLMVTGTNSNPKYTPIN